MPVFTEAPTTAPGPSLPAAEDLRCAGRRPTCQFTACPLLLDQREAAVTERVKVITPRLPEALSATRNAKEAATARIMRATSSVLGKALQQTRYQPTVVRIVLREHVPRSRTNSVICVTGK